MRRFLIAAGVTGAVFVAALVVAPTVIDWNGYRAALAAELSRATGRTVVLAGPIEATFLPSPRILANNVRLSGPDADDGDLLRLRAVELQVGLLPLLTGHIVVERLTLVRPEILVETAEDGRLTWVMDGAGGDLLPPVALQRFAISDGTLVWRDHDGGVRTRIEKVSLRLAADSLSGPAKAEGGAEIDGVPVRFTAGIGRINGETPVPFNLALEATGLRAKGDFIGRYLSAEKRITGRLKANGSDARAMLAALLGPDAGQGTAVALVAHPFNLEGRVSATVQAVDVNDVIVSLADQRITGTVQARPGDGAHPTAIEAAFSAPRLDLDSLATVPSLPVAADAKPATLPRDLSVALDFTSDALLAGGKVVQGFIVKGALNDGAFALDRFEGQLPGAGSFRVAGTLAGQDRLRFSGTVDARAANLRDLLSWLEVDASAIPAGRLANATIKAKIAADGERADLSDVDLHLDATRAHGTVGLDYRDQPRVALDLAADNLDLDAYLGGDVPSAAVATPGILSGLSGEGRFSIGRLTYRGMDLRAVDIAATIAGGEFTVADFSGVPPEPGEFAPDGGEPVATAPPSEVPVTAAATPAGPAVAVPSPPAQAPPPESSPEPSSAPPDTRDSFVRGILDILGR